MLYNVKVSIFMMNFLELPKKFEIYCENYKSKFNHNIQQKNNSKERKLIPFNKITYQTFSVLYDEDNIKILTLLNNLLDVNDLVSKMNEPLDKIQKQLDVLKKNHFIEKRFVTQKIS